MVFYQVTANKNTKRKKYPIETLLQRNFNFKLIKSKIIMQNKLFEYIYVF